MTKTKEEPKELSQDEISSVTGGTDIPGLEAIGPYADFNTQAPDGKTYDNQRISPDIQK